MLCTDNTGKEERKEMSRQYDLYLEQHKANVTKGFRWFAENLPEFMAEFNGIDLEHQICFAHDASKTDANEYHAYDNYFYGNRSYQVVQDFKLAWLEHIHKNPHHWQHWVLINDDPNEGVVALDMPTNYILEMVCDWWAFSWANGNLTEIFKWYEEHEKYMKLSQSTRDKVEALLSLIKTKLEESNEDK